MVRRCFLKNSKILDLEKREEGRRNTGGGVVVVIKKYEIMMMDGYYNISSRLFYLK